MLSIKRLPLLNNNLDLFLTDFWDTVNFAEIMNVNYTSKVENNNLYLSVDLPGVKRENLLCEYDKGYVMLNWSRNNVKKSQNLYVGNKYDFTKANVSLEDGVLLIEVPLKENIESSKIKLLK